MNIPRKGTMERAWAELVISVYRPLRPLMRWMARQPWVIAYAAWDERHVPSWFTFWNIAYAGIVLWGIVLTALWLLAGDAA